MRFSKLFFRAVLCGSLSLCLLGGAVPVSAYTGSAPKEKTAGTNLRVMSYNVLVDNDESLGGWSWGQALGGRGDKASACIEYYQPDVIGFQECNYKWHVSLKDNLKDYAFVNADVPEEQLLEKAESLGKKDWMCTTMMYNKKTLKLISNELIGYSCNYWGCIQRMRYVSAAVFQIKATGERFAFISTHLDAEQDEKGQQMRMTQSTELADTINRYKATYGYPVISTGDYNSGYSDPPIQNVVQNAGMTASVDNRGGIDYILYSAGIVSKYFTVVSDTDVSGASDHNPVFADVQVQKYTFPTTKETTTTTTVTTTTTTTTDTTTTTTQGLAVVVTKPTSATTTQTTTAAVSTGETESPTQGEVVTQATDTTLPVDTTMAEEVTTTWVTTEPSTEAAPTEQTTTAGTVTEKQEEMIPETEVNSESGVSLSLWIPIAAAGGGVLLVGGAFLAVYLLVLKKKL